MCLVAAFLGEEAERPECAFDIAEELVKTMDLPKGLQGDSQREQGQRRDKALAPPAWGQPGCT